MFKSIRWRIALPYVALIAVVMLALGVYIAGWFQTMAPLEKLGSHFWRLIEPVGRRLLPVTSYPKAFSLGFIWGWLPCGLVYSTLALAATAADLVKTPMLMLAFGLGTLPLLLAMGGLAGMAAAGIGAYVLRRGDGGKSRVSGQE